MGPKHRSPDLPPLLQCATPKEIPYKGSVTPNPLYRTPSRQWQFLGVHEYITNESIKHRSSALRKGLFCCRALFCAFRPRRPRDPEHSPAGKSFLTAALLGTHEPLGGAHDTRRRLLCSLGRSPSRAGARRRTWRKSHPTAPGRPPALAGSSAAACQDRSVQAANRLRAPPSPRGALRQAAGKAPPRGAPGASGKQPHPASCSGSLPGSPLTTASSRFPPGK